MDHVDTQNSVSRSDLPWSIAGIQTERRGRFCEAGPIKPGLNARHVAGVRIRRLPDRIRQSSGKMGGMLPAAGGNLET